jgi:hypothetical protein
MGPKHHMNTLKCFGMTSSSQTLWIGLFGMLSSYTDCACDAALKGRSPCFGKIIHMPSEVSHIFFWPPCPCLVRLEDPRVFGS